MRFWISNNGSMVNVMNLNNDSSGAIAGSWDSGGGFGSTGSTLGSDGSGQFNGAITTDSTITSGGEIYSSIAVGSGALVYGSRLKASGAASDPGSGNSVTFGNDAITLEGATNDGDELRANFPSYSDGGAGDQGGLYDATTTLATESEIAISIPDSGADADPAAYTLVTTGYKSTYAITCLDDDECNITLSEVDLGSAAAHGGHRITIVQVTSTYDLNIADSAGVQELSAPWAPDTEGDNISFVYSVALSAWIETGRVDL